MPSSLPSTWDAFPSSLDQKSTSQDEFILNAMYNPTIAKINRDKVNEALLDLKQNKKEFVDVCLSKNNTLTNIVNFCKKNKTKNTQEVVKETVKKEPVTEADHQAFEKSRHSKKSKRVKQEKVVKDKSFFKNNFCDSWD